MMFKASSVVLLVLVAIGCGEVKSKNNDSGNGGGTMCNSNGTCSDPSQYCDVDGSIGGMPNTCISVTCTAGDFKTCKGSSSELVCNPGGNGYDTMPCVNGCVAGTGCQAVSCTANQPLRCDGNNLVSCNAEGNGAVNTACDLGCDGTALKCKGVDPSNNLASNLDQAAAQGDVTLPSGTTIDTNTGTVTGPSGAIAVASSLVSQSGGPMLRVLIAKSFAIGDVRVSGGGALALVAAGDITITGTLDLSADGVNPGPGAVACAGTGEGGVNNNGFFQRVPAGNSGGYPTYLWDISGGGGGGFGSVGGAGGAGGSTNTATAGGVTNGNATLVPLRGGCPGGDSNSGPHGGRGGGAVQLVANGTVHLVAGSTNGQIHVGGGGGEAGELGRAATTDTNPVYSSGGGGAGGGILIEAATVTLDAGTGLWAAGGGGGGWGACASPPNGMDAPANASTPSGGACPVGTTPATTGGDGATTGDGGAGQATTTGSSGGGGGGLGRIRINTADATYMSQGATVRGAVTTAIVQSR